MRKLLIPLVALLSLLSCQSEVSTSSQNCQDGASSAARLTVRDLSSRAHSIDPALHEFAQNGDEKMDSSPALRSALSIGSKGEKRISLFLRGKSINPDEIRKRGCDVGTVAGDILTVECPSIALANVLNLVGVEQAQAAQPMEVQSNVSIPEIGAQNLWGGTGAGGRLPPYTGTTGKNVVIGIVDFRLDTSHPDLRTATGTRIKWLWDQNIGLAAPPPSGYNYGGEYSEAAINSGSYTPGDMYGHGTHIAGIAAGNGRAHEGCQNNAIDPPNCNGQPDQYRSEPQYKYVGVAPEADLVVVGLRPGADGITILDTRVIDGVNYVFQKAAALGKPAVVLLAIEKKTGPHDGQDPLDLAISAMAGPGKLIVAAAGNYGGNSLHAEQTSTASGQVLNMTLSVSPYNPSAIAADFLQSEAWYNAGANFNVSVITPAGEVIGPVPRGGTTTVESNSGIVKITNGQYTSANGSYFVDLFVYRGNTILPQVASGTWTYCFTSATAGTHRVDAWLIQYALGGKYVPFVIGKSESRLVSSPATADNVIAVGAYTTKRNWTAEDGKIYGYSLAVMNDLAYFSSPGPRRDGQPVPHITAPGFAVSSSRSSQYHPGASKTMPDDAHVIMYGTSQAAAHVAGVAALLLQAYPTFTPLQFKNYLAGKAASDSFTGAVPNNRWGAGKLRVGPTLTGANAVCNLPECQVEAPKCLAP